VHHTEAEMKRGLLTQTLGGVVAFAVVSSSGP